MEPSGTPFPSGGLPHRWVLASVADMVTLGCLLAVSLRHGKDGKKNRNCQTDHQKRLRQRLHKNPKLGDQTLAAAAGWRGARRRRASTTRRRRRGAERSGAPEASVPLTKASKIIETFGRGSRPTRARRPSERAARPATLGGRARIWPTRKRLPSISDSSRHSNTNACLGLSVQQIGGCRCTADASAESQNQLTHKAHPMDYSVA